MLDDDGEFGLLSPIQANPDDTEDLMPLVFDGVEADGDEQEGLKDDGIIDTHSTLRAPNSSSNSSVSFSTAASEDLIRNFPPKDRIRVPYRRFSWQ